MIKIFIGLIFLSELVLFFNFIINILKLNKKVNDFNDSVTATKAELKPFFLDIRAFVEDIKLLIEDTLDFINQKQIEYTQNVLKKTIFYAGVVFLRGKYKKSFIIYQLAREIYRGFRAGINFT